MTTPVAHRVCESTGKRLRDITTPPTSKPRPARNPIVTRRTGGTRLLSKEYFTKNTTPRNSASPPIHAKPFTPTNSSQLIFRAGRGGGFETGSDVVVGGRKGEKTGGGATIGLADVAVAGEVAGVGLTTFGCSGSAEPGFTGSPDFFFPLNLAIFD